MPDSKHRFLDLCQPNCETKFIAEIFTHLKDKMAGLDSPQLHFIRQDVFAKPDHRKENTVFLLTGNEQHRQCNHFQSQNTVAIFQAYPPLPKPWKSINENGRWVIPTLPKRPIWFDLPLGCTTAFNQRISHDRSLDLFFAGQLNPQRMDVIQKLNNIHDIIPDLKALVHIYRGFAFSGNTTNALTPRAYARFLGQSKIALCLGGKSPETFRHYEAAASGCIVLSSPLPQIPMYTESPFIIVNQWDSKYIGQLLKAILRDPNALEHRSKAHLEWYQKWASARGVANQIIKSLKKIGVVK